MLLGTSVARDLAASLSIEVSRGARACELLEQLFCRGVGLRCHRPLRSSDGLRPPAEALERNGFDVVHAVIRRARASRYAELLCHRNRVEAIFEQPQLHVRHGQGQSRLPEAGQKLDADQAGVDGLLCPFPADQGQLHLELPCPRPRSFVQGIARQNRPDVRVLRADVSVAEVQLMAASSELMPQLDLVSSYSTEGVDQTFRSGLSGTTGLDFPDWSVRLEFSVPIGNSAAIANHARASLELERARRVLYGVEMDVDMEVREVVRQLHSLAESIRATNISVSTALDTLLTEQIKLRVGNSTAFEVQSRNQELRQARSRLLRNQLDYRIAQTQLLHVQGILQGPDGTEPEGGR